MKVRSSLTNNPIGILAPLCGHGLSGPPLISEFLAMILVPLLPVRLVHSVKLFSVDCPNRRNLPPPYRWLSGQEGCGARSTHIAVGLRQKCQRVCAPLSSLARSCGTPQVSVDVPWSPFDIDGRNYDWGSIGTAADIVFVMAYDMQSQMYGPCLATANSPYPLVERGLRQWIDLGIPVSKIVLGLPWCV